MEQQIFCNKCGKEINIKEDDWYRNTLFFGEEIDSEIYFHRKCYKEFHHDKFKEEFNKKMRFIVPTVKKLLGRNN